MASKKSSNNNLPVSWINFHKTLCDSCLAACCSLQLEITVTDLLALKLISEEETETIYRKELYSQLQRRGIVERYNSKSDKFILARKPSGECIFLSNEKRCQVYDSRPHVCRQFPLNEYFGGKCPYKRKARA